jgi:uncharacterized protein
MNWPVIIDLLRQRLPKLLAVYGFGSRITGQAQAGSDLDLAVLVAGKVDPVILWQVAGELAEIVTCEVDLVDLRTASTVMQYQIITTGKRLWNQDQQAPIYESFILSEKTALDEARGPLLAIIQKEGTIHGR